MPRDSWTEADLPELSGRTAIVTGANSGIGYELTRMLAERGAHVVMATRTVKRGQAAARELREGTDGELSVRRCNLADLDSVRTFAEDATRDLDRLDFLFNNAGVMAIPRSETEDGFETQFGVNHLGHFALTGRLLDLLVESPGESRVLTQSSGFHERGRIDFEDLQSESTYDKWAAYSQSKLANVLFAYELQRRLDRAGVEDLYSVATHPGYADTSLQRRGPEQSGSVLRLWFMKIANALFAQSPRKGAWPMLYAATAPEIEGGEYVGPTGLLNLRGSPGVQASSERSRDETLARRLWDVSSDLTGVEYDELD